jgi:hypothetical protein
MSETGNVNRGEIKLKGDLPEMRHRSSKEDGNRGGT